MAYAQYNPMWGWLTCASCRYLYLWYRCRNPQSYTCGCRIRNALCK